MEEQIYTNDSVASGMFAGIGALFIIIYFAIIILIIVAQWKVFAKAGKPGWACLIPIYSTIVFLEIIKKPIWWILLLIIPIVNVVILIIMANELSKSFGKSTGFTVGMIFLPFIFIPILGFGDAKYIAPEGSDDSFQNNLSGRL